MSDFQIAHAKLTVHLHITGVRADGYHLIDAEMVSLDLVDTLEFSEATGETIIEVVGADRLPTGPTNLVAKALAQAGRVAHVKLTKQIPIGGGLGGGSSDAAAALRWAESLDTGLAAQIGADVPFCLFGGRGRVQGIGEIIERLPFEERQYTLLLPPFGVNTAAVYAKYDEISPGFNVHAANDLEAAAIAVEPRLTLWRDKLSAWTGGTPRLAGSGSTWFVEGFHNEPSQQELRGARWIAARTVPSLLSGDKQG